MNFSIDVVEGGEHHRKGHLWLDWLGQLEAERRRAVDPQVSAVELWSSWLGLQWQSQPHSPCP